jgi:hypothetical protein
LNDSGYRLHHTSPAHFRAAALQKCYICSRNWAKVPEPYRLKWEEVEDNTLANQNFMRYRFVRNTNEQVTEILTEPTEFPALEILWTNMFPLQAWATFYHLVPTQRLEITGEDDQLTASFRSDPTFSGSFFLNHGSSTSSLRSLQLIKEWCSDCEKNHSACKVKNTGDIPTRMIEIGTTKWRLCHTTEEAYAEPVKFVALSYRWPKIPSIRLLKSTEPNFRRGQQIFALPQLFQDAMKVAVFLGVRYIWIDALCIIQDSPDDWSYESVRMTNVYANSYCTIAAAASADPNDSLFKERSPEDILPGIAECNTTQGSVPILGTFAILERDSWHREFEASVLQLRGWCLQERILAPRTIHFATRQLLWECGALLQNETFRDKFPYPRPASTIRIPSMWHLDQNDSDILASGVAFREWSNIIKSYSRCALTEANDKLVAISGLASFFHKRTNDTYLAGMWRYNLLDYLLWMSAPFPTANDRMETLLDLILLRHRGDEPARSYIAPSWSWASHHKGVYFSFSNADSFPFATLLDAQVTTIDGGTFSRITDGFVYIQGPFFSTSGDGLTGGERRLVSEDANIPSLTPTILLDQIGGPRIKHCILLLLKVNYSGGDWGYGRIEGLVLQPRTESLEEYVRIGVFYSYVCWNKLQRDRYDSELRNTAPGQHNQKVGYGAYKIY